MRVRTPAQLACAEQNLLRPQLEDHVGIGADPDPRNADLSQERIEFRPVETLLDRIHPHEHTVEPEQLLPHVLDVLVRVHDRLSDRTERSERLEDAMQLAALRDRPASTTGSHSVRQSTPILGASASKLRRNASELRDAEKLVDRIPEDVSRPESVRAPEVDRTVHFGDDEAVAERE